MFVAGMGKALFYRLECLHSYTHVKINEDTLSENKQSLFIQSLFSRGVSYLYLCLAMTQR